MLTTQCSQKPKRDLVVGTFNLSRRGGNGRKTALHFFRCSDDDISDRQVFKNELEEGGNSGRL